MSDTPEHPRINGYAQLIHARIGSTNVDTRVRVEESHGAVEFLDVATAQNTISFSGEIDLRDARNLNVRLFPNQQLYDLTGPFLDCTNRLEIVPEVQSLFGWPVGEVDLRGDVPRRDWNLNLISWDLVSRSFRFCSGKNGVESALSLGVQSPPSQPSPTPKPTRPRKRKR